MIGIELPKYTDDAVVIFPSYSYLLYKGVPVPPTPTPIPNQAVAAILAKDPLVPLTPAEKETVWNNRLNLQGIPKAAIKVVQCVNWADPPQIAEMLA